MLQNIAIGTLLIVLTTAIHAMCMVITLRVLEHRTGRRRMASKSQRLLVVSGTILLFFGAALLEVTVWAVAFLILGAISGLEPALYFSMVTYTTLGYGDVLLGEQWRLLSSFEAANGIMMFGWTTALVIAVVQRTYAKELQRAYRKEDS